MKDNETIQTGEYSNYDTAMSTISSMGTSIEEKKTEVAGYKNQLGNESIFMGPICDSALEGIDSLTTKLTQNVTNYDTIKSYVGQVKSNYQAADDSAKQLYLSIKSDGSIGVGEAPVYVNDKAEKYQVDFINKILPSALALYASKGILPSLTIGQACKESAFGTARPGEGYNVFGIKAAGWSGKKANASTQEDTSKGLKTINADFRDYDILEAAVQDYGEVLSLERYDAVRAAKDYKEAAHAVKAGGYATGRNYDNSLIKDFIEAYNLNQWDPVK